MNYKSVWPVIVIVSLIGTTALAQTANTLAPTTTQKETSTAQNGGQNLFHMYRSFDNTLRGSLLYAGGNAAGNKYFGFQNNAADYLLFATVTYHQFNAPLNTQQMIVNSSGVTIGTNPAATAVKLTVNGAIDVKAGIAAQYQDVAEWVPALGDPTPGTVVIVDGDNVNTVTASETPYDTRVAGVVSPQPGLILGVPGDDKVMVATTGRVKVRVDASAAPIKIGDLLVTSEKPGVAMKSIPVDVAGIKMHRPGTVVGKALEPLASGTGEILVLLSMQ